MSKNVLFALLIALAFMGIADAWYLAQSAYTDTPLVCNIGSTLDGCNTVAQSPYAHLFGIPLGVYGAIFYSLVFIVGAIGLVELSRHAYRALYILGLIGAAASVVFECIQIFLIKAICIYCLGSAVLSFAIFYVAHRLYARHHPDKIAHEPVVKPW